MNQNFFKNHSFLEIKRILNAVDENNQANSQLTLPLIAIFVVFVLGLSGSLIPPAIVHFYPKYDLNTKVYFRFFNGLAAGVVVGVGFIHSLPDAFTSFNNALIENNLTDQYSWCGFIAMVSALITFFAEEMISRNLGRFGVVHGHEHVHNHGNAHENEDITRRQAANNERFGVVQHENGHDNGNEDIAQRQATNTELVPETIKVIGNNQIFNADLEKAEIKDQKIEKEDENQRKYYTELGVLMFGLCFHSYFVGLALGVVSDDWGLFTAIIFHQFFEGLALGARVARANFKNKIHVWLIDLWYALAVPIGVAIGLGIKSQIVNNQYQYDIADGTVQAMSGGILIYMGLVHMMKEELERKEFRNGGSILIAMYIGFLAGSGAMAIIGIWA